MAGAARAHTAAGARGARGGGMAAAVPTTANNIILQYRTHVM